MKTQTTTIKIDKEPKEYVLVYNELFDLIKLEKVQLSYNDNLVYISYNDESIKLRVYEAIQKTVTPNMKTQETITVKIDNEALTLLKLMKEHHNGSAITNEEDLNHAVSKLIKERYASSITRK